MTPPASSNPSAPSASPAPRSAAPSERARFLETYRREHETTAKVLRAFPASQSELRPHERSNSARALAWTFVIEEQLMLRALKGEPILQGGIFVEAPAWDQILTRFAEQHEEIVKRLERASDEDLNGTVQFFVAPKQIGDYRTLDFFWLMVYDQIHHRGQLSVYLRMAGGKVPSIYGPSADEPWT